jgi:hypothetical protein
MAPPLQSAAQERIMAGFRFGPFLLLLSAFAVCSCEDTPLSSSIARLGTAPSAAVNLTGTWTGSAVDSAGRVDMVWQLTQSGSAVTGTVTAATNVGLPLYTGSVSGTLASDALRFTVTVPAGRIADMPDCTLDLSGSVTDIQPNSMAGTYTGMQSCTGAVEAGRLLLIGQQ